MANWLQGLSSLFGGGRKDAIATSRELQAFVDVYGSRQSIAGESVTWSTALDTATILAICRVLAEGVAQVPFRLSQDTGAGRVLARDHSLYQVLFRRPNAWQTSFEFRETLMFHLVLTNNAYVFVNRVGIARTVRELIPIEPQRVEVRQLDDMRLEYRVRAKNGAVQVFGQDAIWHLRGPSWNSWHGLDATRLARNSIGLSMAIEKGQANFQQHGAQTPGAFSTKETLGKEQFEFLAAWLDRHLPGGDRWGKPLVLDGEAKFSAMMMSGVDQQLVETRKLQIEEMCRGFRVMPMMVGHPADMAARAATESIFQMHVTHTLMPWYERIRQSADVNLLTQQERDDGYYTNFTVNALMKGNAKDRADYYAKALGSGGTKGWLTQNEVRDLEDVDRNSDPAADKLPQPTNVKQPAPAPQDTPAKEEEEDDDNAV